MQAALDVSARRMAVADSFTLARASQGLVLASRPAFAGDDKG